MTPKNFGYIVASVFLGISLGIVLFGIMVALFAPAAMIFFAPYFVWVLGLSLVVGVGLLHVLSVFK